MIGNSSAKAVLRLEPFSLELRTESVPKKVIDRVAFELYPGEILGLVGESGSGKSLLSLSLLGLWPEGISMPTVKQFLFQEKPYGKGTDLPFTEIRGKRIAVIFQEPMTAFNPVFSIGEQLTEAVRLHQGLKAAEAIEKTKDLLVKVGLPDAATRLADYPHQFSGGQRQRLMIAMALALDPDILIADEPTTALDVTIQAQILRLLRQIVQSDNKSMIFISHDLHVVSSLCDRISVMKEGQIVEEGLVKNILHKATHPYTQKLLHAIPRLSDPAPDPKTSSEILLELDDLKHYFPVKQGWLKAPLQLKAVDGISLTIRSGERLGLVGESGCGKSTLGKTLLNLNPDFEGSIRFRGQSLKGLKGKDLKQWKKHIQIIFQDPYSSLNPKMTVRQILAEPLEVHGRKKIADQDLVEMLKLVQLDTDILQRFPHEFSGGQRQRIAIARALIVEPELLIADEALSALDVSIQAQILELLTDICERRNIALLFISHNIAVVKKLCHRMAVMYLGKIVEIGPGEKLIAAPAHHYSKKLIDAIPKPEVKVDHHQDSEQNEEIPSAVHRPAGCAFHPRCPAASDLCREKTPALKTTDNRAYACHHPIGE